jgi:hypothetical protein
MRMAHSGRVAREFAERLEHAPVIGRVLHERVSSAMAGLRVFATGGSWAARTPDRAAGGHRRSQRARLGQSLNL